MKPNLFIVAAIYVTALTACIHEKRVTIATDTNGSYRKIEYTGIVAFNQFADGIVRMSPHSWLQYKENGLVLKVDCDVNGSISYTLNGGEKSAKPTAEEKSALIRAANLAAGHTSKPAHS